MYSLVNTSSKSKNRMFIIRYKLEDENDGYFTGPPEDIIGIYDSLEEINAIELCARLVQDWVHLDHDTEEYDEYDLKKFELLIKFFRNIIPMNQVIDVEELLDFNLLTIQLYYVPKGLHINKFKYDDRKEGNKLHGDEGYLYSLNEFVQQFYKQEDFDNFIKQKGY